MLLLCHNVLVTRLFLLREHNSSWYSCNKSSARRRTAKIKRGGISMGLVVEHINKSFAQFQVIKDLSMEVKEGAIFGFLGANGAGKTTTMRMILDILRPDSGRITWNGKDVREVPRKNWGYLPEERGLYPKMRVDEQLLFLARLNGVSKQAAEKELDEWLGRFQMPPQTTPISPRYRSWRSNSTSSIYLIAWVSPRLKRVACLLNQALPS